MKILISAVCPSDGQMSVNYEVPCKVKTWSKASSLFVPLVPTRIVLPTFIKLKSVGSTQLPETQVTCPVVGEIDISPDTAAGVPSFEVIVPVKSPLLSVNVKLHVSIASDVGPVYNRPLPAQ